MEGIELISFKIISAVGEARSAYIEAITLAEEGKFLDAEEKIKIGNDFFSKGHLEHAKLLQEQAKNNTNQIDLLLVHAEDQLMSAETFNILADKFVLLYKKIDKLN